MKSAGVSASKARESHAFGASLAAMLLVVFSSALASAQSDADTTASETWKIAAASAAASPTAAGPSNLVPTPPDNDPTPSGAMEIAPISPDTASQQQPAGIATDPQSANDGSEVTRYQEEQSGMPPEQLKALQDFDSEGELSSPFGMQLREAKRSLKTGEEADGLLITAVTKGSPAAAVGLRPYTHTVHDAIAAAAMVGAVFSGGLSVVVIPAIDYMQVGESYDMIIGVDGSRVTNFLDFQDRMRDLQPGEVVYLSVLRDGKRVQVTLPVPANILQATN
jgi:S1-C subfamily serine protease